MPSSVSGILEKCELRRSGVVAWGEPVPTQRPGVYIVSISRDGQSTADLLDNAPIDRSAVAEWLRRVPKLELDRKAGPTVHELTARLNSFWLPDEVILYIGKATCLSTRVRQYYGTPLGNRSPHAGGHWLKTLSILPELYVHYAEVELPKVAESSLLDAFVRGVSDTAKRGLRDPHHPFPFANLDHPPGTRKTHGIGKAKL